MNILGIDIGGSGIKGAIVDIRAGKMVTDRLREETPEPATPAAVCKTIASITKAFAWKGPIGIGFPGIIHEQEILTAVNLHPAWVGKDISQLVSRATGCPAHAINDADAAGVAEIAFGAGREEKGKVLVLTFGTGIGSALFYRGILIPNMEFGHIQFHHGSTEDYASAAARKNLDLRWSSWSRRVNRVLHYFDLLFSPDLVIIGGGVSDKFDKIARHIDKEIRITPALLQNHAGIIGAASSASHLAAKTRRKPAR